MVVRLVVEAPVYPIPIMLLGCLLEAGLVIWLIATLDYRTWAEPGVGPPKRPQEREKQWRGHSAYTGAMQFALLMMLLVMGLACVMIVDVIND